MIASAPEARQLRRLVADRLRTDILEGKLSPGSWLRQEQIAKEMGVSQMPVREALRELAAEGLVAHEPYRGVRIISMSLTDVADLYASRAAIEALAIRAAARNITAEELASLREISAKMKRRLAPRHLAEYRELNRRFHTVIFTASRRPFLIRLLQQLWTSFPAMLLDSFKKTAAAPIPDRDTDDIAEHQAILEALEKGDPDAAESAIRAHLEETVRHLTVALQEDNPPPEASPRPTTRKPAVGFDQGSGKSIRRRPA
jgi:DNA-binding GntR family transcriptional regulator